MNINENIRNKIKIIKKIRRVPAKLSTFQLLTKIDYQPLYQMNAKTYHVHLMVQYANFKKMYS